MLKGHLPSGGGNVDAVPFVVVPSVTPRGGAGRGGMKRGGLGRGPQGGKGATGGGRGGGRASAGRGRVGRAAFFVDAAKVEVARRAGPLDLPETADQKESWHEPWVYPEERRFQVVPTVFENASQYCKVLHRVVCSLMETDSRLITFCCLWGGGCTRLQLS